MSYILDALKKSEAEHNPVASANLALNQQRNQPRQRLIGILVVAALLTNIAVLVWLFGPTERPAATPVALLARDEAVAEPVQQPVREPVVGMTPIEAAGHELINDDPARRVTASVEPAPRIKARLADLPAAVRGRFPGLAFSTHIYAEDPSFRAVVANGRRMVAGGAIDGVTVAEITESGVILAFENYLIEIPVVAQWQ